ncbi:50S ribosomal protein L13 [Candidatus Peregrinibacteria bacterium]|nr:50S ribosomal protein L13 [Candidatus Peregrinibacteria bacterium]
MKNIKLIQKSYVPSEKDMEKKWFIVDVKDKTLGPTAVKIADLLRGKGKPFFTPQKDCGDHIVVVNAKHIRLSGNKMDTKMYHWHTRYPAGFRSRTAREIMAKKPEKVLEDAVFGMLPRTRTRKVMMRRLRIFPELEHDHKTQSPKPIEL